MITHRMSTQPLPEPPVKFYKIIAVSFLILTVVLLGVVIFITSKTASITIIAKQDTEPITLAVQVSVDASGENEIHGTVSTTKFAWTENYQPTGNKKVLGTSKGEVIIYNKSAAAQSLVKTTRLLTANGILFHLSVGTVVPANGQVTVPVYADQQGVTYDIAPSNFTIPGLNVEKQKVVFAESKKAMTGGEETLGVLSNEDITSAKDNYQQKVKDAFLAHSPSAPAGMTRIISLGDAALKTDHVAGDEVSGFKVFGTSTITIVSYNSNELSNLLTKQVESKIDTTAEKFLSLSMAPTVTVSSGSIKDDTAQLSVRQEVGVTLDSNVPKLSLDHFYGKNKSEISRYILGLDHVQGVDVQFSPAWVFTAPTVAERIHIVVKNI
jgi:hypothetical protein